MKHHCTVAIIGGSFAGLSALLQLRKRLGQTISIKMFDMRDKFTHIPGLHEAILKTSYIPKLQLSLPKYYPQEFIHQKVTTIKAGELQTQNSDTRTFDYGVIATGARTNFFGNDQFEKNAYKVTYPEDIPPLNTALEKAKHITVIGGGYTGIEIASIIAERKKPHQHLRVIHAQKRLFNRLSEHISHLAENRLHRHHVELFLNQRVREILPESIIFESGQRLPSDVTIVARGIKANDEAHRPWLTFDGSYTALECSNMYMCGDVATHGLLMTGHNAMIEGRRIGNFIADKLQRTERVYQPITNRDKLAIALGSYDGILTNGTKGIYIPKLMGFAKRCIHQRVFFEFKTKIMIPV